MDALHNEVFIHSVRKIRYIYVVAFLAPVAQRIERQTSNLQVVSSILAGGADFARGFTHNAGFP